ncbi:MAG: hypothetical protein MHMPM18_000178 [Marteilia pararefringens]
MSDYFEAGKDSRIANSSSLAAQIDTKRHLNSVAQILDWIKVELGDLSQDVTSEDKNKVIGLILNRVVMPSLEYLENNSDIYCAAKLREKFREKFKTLLLSISCERSRYGMKLLIDSKTSTGAYRILLESLFANFTLIHKLLCCLSRLIAKTIITITIITHIMTHGTMILVLDDSSALVSFLSQFCTSPFESLQSGSSEELASLRFFPPIICDSIAADEYRNRVMINRNSINCYLLISVLINKHSKQRVSRQNVSDRIICFLSLEFKLNYFDLDLLGQVLVTQDISFHLTTTHRIAATLLFAIRSQSCRNRPNKFCRNSER